MQRVRLVPSEGRKSAQKSKKPRIEEPVSAGGVVYRIVDGQIETVLCGRDNPIRWSLAKGTPDRGETLEETAAREVREETGLEVQIQEPIKSIDYWFADRENDIRFHKTVHFYLMVPTGGNTDQHDPEFDVVQWFPSDIALKTLAYANEAEVLKQALELISKRREGG
jgi:8-oxo-dGTP pyrophosphatase MutT (NUDIX family)